jgi:hypothetical protein
MLCLQDFSPMHIGEGKHLQTQKEVFIRLIKIKFLTALFFPRDTRGTLGTHLLIV